MKNILMMGSAAVLSLGLLLAACSDDETTAATTINPTTGGNGGTGNMGGGGAGAQGGGGGTGVPEIPSLGAQIDRKGRPAVNTATTNTFDLAAGNPDMAREDAEKAYNANDEPSTWATSYAANIAANLAVYDSLADSAADGNCGDQTFFGTLGNAGYGTLSTVLANDWLTIFSGETTCGYLGVEVDILTGAATPTSCGGRTLTDDVMDATYSLVAPAVGFGDTIDAPSAPVSDTFPYLAAADAN